MERRILSHSKYPKRNELIIYTEVREMQFHLIIHAYREQDKFHNSDFFQKLLRIPHTAKTKLLKNFKFWKDW